MPSVASRTIVVSGPSKVGKTTLLAILFEKYPKRFEFGIPHTSRAPRIAETDGIDYHFVPEKKFEEMIDNDCFVEWSKYDGHYYGTSKVTVQRVRWDKVCVLELNMWSVQQLKKFPKETFNPVFVFVKPTNLLELELRQTGCSGLDAHKRRIETQAAIQYQESNLKPYDYVLVNDDLNITAGAFEIIINKECGFDQLL